MTITEKLLEVLGFPLAARTVYVDLLRHGKAGARVIAERLSMTRGSVYDQLKLLGKRGLVVEKDIDGKTIFAIHDVRDLERLVDHEEKRLAELRHEFEQEKEDLIRRTATTEPKIKFLSGKEGILQAMHDILWDESQVIQAVWPYEEMLRALGKDELALFNKKRIKNRIRLQTVWPGKDGQKKVGTGYIWQDGDWGVERRFAPAEFAPSMACVLYDQKALFISSAAEAFGFTVESADFAELKRAEFALLWKASKK